MDFQGRDIRPLYDDTYTIENVLVTNGTEIRFLPEHKDNDQEPFVVIHNSTVSRILRNFQWMLPNSNEWTDVSLDINPGESGVLKLPYAIDANHNLYSFRMVLSARERSGNNWVMVPFTYSRNNVTVHNGMNIEILQSSIELPEGKFIVRTRTALSSPNRAAIRPAGTVQFTEHSFGQMNIHYHILPIPGGGDSFDVVLTRGSPSEPGGRVVVAKFNHSISPDFVVLFTSDDVITERPSMTFVNTNTSECRVPLQSTPTLRPSGVDGWLGSWSAFSGQNNLSVSLQPGESVTRYLPYPVEMFTTYDFSQGTCQCWPPCGSGNRRNLMNVGVGGTINIPLPCSPFDD
jgi:hypothetical protein